MMEKETPLRSLIHEVKSKCGTLIHAAERLRESSPAEQAEIVDLMLPRAEEVVRLIKAFRGGVVDK